MDIQNKRIPEGEFMKMRQEILTQWPTGKDVDLEEAVAYHKAMPESRKFGKKLLDAKKAGKTLVQPRAGVPDIDAHIKLLQFLQKGFCTGVVSTVVGFKFLLHGEPVDKAVHTILLFMPFSPGSKAHRTPPAQFSLCKAQNP